MSLQPTLASLDQHSPAACRHCQPATTPLPPSAHRPGAGIAAGFARNLPDNALPWLGVAHQATIGAYRIAPCPGEPGYPGDWSGRAGIDQALWDAMDVINLSW